VRGERGMWRKSPARTGAEIPSESDRKRESGRVRTATARRMPFSAAGQLAAAAAWGAGTATIATQRQCCPKTPYPAEAPWNLSPPWTRSNPLHHKEF